jgi:hypothetical protein
MRKCAGATYHCVPPYGIALLKPERWQRNPIVELVWATTVMKTYRDVSVAL